MPSPFPCSPVIRECSWNKTQIEKKLLLRLERIFNENYYTYILCKDENKKHLGILINSVQKLAFRIYLKAADDFVTQHIYQSHLVHSKMFEFGY